VLVAVSGGPDSTALLAALSELAADYGVTLKAAHFNHGLRHEEADRDQRAVEDLCARFDVPLVIEKSQGGMGGGNIEEQARTVRYDFLLRTGRSLGCNRVATGHTSDDQAETVLMRLLRGSGVDGMAGIRPVRADGVIRPLIDCERTQVVEYLHRRHLPYATDSMNSDVRFLRTRIRHEALPLLRSINPAITRTLVRAARNFAADADLLGHLAGEALRGAADGDAIAIAKLRTLPGPLRERVVRRWLREQRGSLRGIAASHLLSIYNLLDDPAASKEIQLPGEGSVLREYDGLRFLANRNPPVAFVTPVKAGSIIELDCGWQVSVDLIAGPAGLPKGERTLWHFWADAEAVGGELLLRSARRGDRIEPLGVAGHRKLQDVFVDGKLPRSRRWTHPVLEASGRILWVPGLVRSNHALISEATRAAWRVVIATSAVAGR
jgi:tRNA(Ile)-lysidine synthase